MALVEQLPEACPAGFVQVTGAPPPEHWNIAEKVTVGKLFGLGETAELEQFEESVDAKLAVVLGALSWW